jgi:hypothetical protein
MGKEDIEVEIIRRYTMNTNIETHIRNVETRQKISSFYFNTEEEDITITSINTIENIQEYKNISFYVNGRIAELKIRGKNHIYHHEFYNNGVSMLSDYVKGANRAYRYKKYDQYGRTLYKKVYKKSGEKDYVVVYWYEPRLPEEEGHVIRANASIRSR